MSKEPRTPLQEISALMAERAKYESWIASLEARRETTPDNVFDRVHADYDTRLQEVLDQLSGHRDSLGEQVEALSARMEELEKEEQQRGDERAELELRSHVGELTGADFEGAVKGVDEVLVRLAAEKTSTGDELKRTQDFLAAAVAPRTTPAASSKPTEAPEPQRDSARKSKGRGKSREPEPDSDDDAEEEEESDVEDSEESEESEKAKPAKAATKGKGSRPSNFDELAFLNSVVGSEEREAAARASSGAGAGKKPAPEPEPDSEPDADAPVHEETSILIRASGEIAQQKTLKCAECGAMNYATEWYCERCGAELAAL